MTKVARYLLLLLYLAPLGVWGAELLLPKGFYATSLNGVAVSPHDDRIRLNEGKQVVALRYANPYRFHKEFHELVVSRPFYLVFRAQAQGKYEIHAQLPTKLEAAKRFARRPVVELMRGEEPVAFRSYMGDEILGALLSESPLDEFPPR